MRLLKWLRMQLWKHPLLSGIVAAVAIIMASSWAATALPGHATAIYHVEAMVVEVLVWLLLLLLIIKAVRWMSPKEKNTAAVVVAVVGWIVYFLGFQVLVAALASSGDFADSFSWLKGRFTGGIVGGWVIPGAAGACWLGIPGLLIIYPQQLRRRLPWDRATELSQTLLPAWLAAAAAVITWAYVLLLHFGGGPLARTSVLVLLVAGFGVATLLVPLYQFLARSCWQSGSDAVFDPVRWYTAVVTVYREINAVDPSQAMLRKSTDTRERRGDSDPDDGAGDS